MVKSTDKTDQLHLIPFHRPKLSMGTINTAAVDRRKKLNFRVRPQLTVKTVFILVSETPVDHENWAYFRFRDRS